MNPSDSNTYSDPLTLSDPPHKSQGRLNTVIRSVASSSGDDRLVGIAEGGSEGQSIGEEINRLTQQVHERGLESRIVKDSGLSMSQELQMLKEILNDSDGNCITKEAPANGGRVDLSNPTETSPCPEPYASEIATLKAQNVELLSFIADQSKEIEELRTTNNDSSEIISMQSQLVQEKEGLLKKLENSNAALTQSVQNAKITSELKDRNYARLAEEAELLRANAERGTGSVKDDTHREVVRELQKQVDYLQGERAALVVSLSSQMGTNEGKERIELIAEVKEQAEIIQLQADVIRDREKNISNLVAEKEEMQQRLQAIQPREIVQELEALKIKFQDEVSRHSSTVAEKDRHIASLESMKVSDDDKLKELSKSYEAAAAELKVCKEELADGTKSFDEKENLILHLKDEVDTMRLEMIALEESSGVLCGELERLQKANSDVMRNHISVLTEKDARIKALEDERATAMQRVCDSCEATKNALGVSEATVAGLSITVRERDSRIQALETELHNANRKIEKLSKPPDSVEVVAMQSKPENDMVVSTLKMELKCKEGQLKAMENERSEANLRIKQLSEANENKNVGLAELKKEFVEAVSRHQSALREKGDYIKSLELERDAAVVRARMLTDSTEPYAALVPGSDSFTQPSANDKEGFIKTLSTLSQSVATLTAECDQLRVDLSLAATHEERVLELEQLVEDLRNKNAISLRNIEEMTADKEYLDKRLVTALENCRDQEEIIDEQNKFLSDAAVSFDKAESEISSLNDKLLASQEEIKRLGQSVERAASDASMAELKLRVVESELSQLKLDYTSLSEQLVAVTLERDVALSKVKRLEFNETRSTSNTEDTIQRKDVVPRTLFIQLQRDNYALIKKLLSEVTLRKALQDILRSTCETKELVSRKVNESDFKPASDVDYLWLKMNSSPAFCGHDLLCAVNRRSSISSCHTISTASITNRDIRIDFGESVSLAQREEYLAHPIRRLRVGWTVDRLLNVEDSSEAIVRVDTDRKKLCASLSEDYSFSLCTVDRITKNEEGLAALGYVVQVASTIVAMRLKTGETLALKFMVSEERDLFYDSILCILCKLEPTFIDSLPTVVSTIDLNTSRFLKNHIIQNPNGEMEVVSFNRRNLLRAQSSIAALQSAGCLSRTETSMMDVLGLEEEVSRTTSAQPPCDDISISAKAPRNLDADDNNISTNQKLEQLPPEAPCDHPSATKEDGDSIKSQGVIGGGTNIFVGNDKNLAEDQVVDMDKLYSCKDRTEKPNYFSIARKGIHRNSFSHENPIQERKNGDNPISPRSDRLSQRQSISTVECLSQEEKSSQQHPQRRPSVGLENVNRFASVYRGRRRSETYSDILRRSGSNCSMDKRPHSSQYFLKIDLDTPEKNSVSRRRGSASSTLAQQTLDFKHRKQLGHRSQSANS